MHYLLRIIAISLLISMQPCLAQNMHTRLVWSDEFNYTGLPDSTKWAYETGFVRNKEPQYYTERRLENARVENGNLVIEAKKESFAGANYTSASLITLGKQQWTYGRIEARAKVPKGIGTWPAIWMLGENRTKVKWPHCGEIDILEFIGKDSTRVFGTVHYSDSLSKYQSEGKRPVVGAPYEEYHIYAAEWYPDRIEFYYDDLKYFVFDLKKSAKAGGNPFQKPFYLLLNLALGRQGTLPGPLSDTALPARYLIDYVRVYQ